MSSDAWCVENCGLPGSAELCTTDLCKCGAVHTIPQAIHPGGNPKTCTAVEGQMESNDAWCVNNCDVANWKAQAPECLTLTLTLTLTPALALTLTLTLTLALTPNP